LESGKPKRRTEIKGTLDGRKDTTKKLKSGKPERRNRIKDTTNKGKISKIWCKL
jgi:hypothetical protein